MLPTVDAEAPSPTNAPWIELFADIIVWDWCVNVGPLEREEAMAERISSTSSATLTVRSFRNLASVRQETWRG